MESIPGCSVDCLHFSFHSYTIAKAGSTQPHYVRVGLVLEDSWIDLYSTLNEVPRDGEWQQAQVHLMRRKKEFRVSIAVVSEVGHGSRSYVALDNIRFIDCDRPHPPGQGCTVFDEFTCANSEHQQ
jgi:hypothetical protein